MRTLIKITALILCCVCVMVNVGCGKEKETETVMAEATENVSTEEPTAEPTAEPTSAPTQKPRKEPGQAKSIYITGNMAGTKYFESRFELTQTTELNAIVLDVKSEEGMILFKGKVPICDELGLVNPLIPDIEALVKRMKDGGLYTIARMVCFKDNGIVEHYPDFALKLSDGSVYSEKGLVWLNPYNHDVWEYLASVAASIAELGFDEIQLDYVRFPTDAQMSRVEFTEEMTGGLSKTEIFIDFAKFMMYKLSPYDVSVAADVFPGTIYSEVDRNGTGQDYVELAKIYDVICPMAYPSHYSNSTLGVEYPDLDPYQILFETLKISKEKLEEAQAAGFKTARIRPWIQDFTATWVTPHQSYGGVQIQQQIDALKDCGIDEWMLWDPKNEFNGYRDLVGQPYD